MKKIQNESLSRHESSTDHERHICFTLISQRLITGCNKNCVLWKVSVIFTKPVGSDGLENDSVIAVTDRDRLLLMTLSTKGT